MGGNGGSNSSSSSDEEKNDGNNKLSENFCGSRNILEKDRLEADLWSAESVTDLHHIYLRYLREAATSKQYSSAMKELKQAHFLYDSDVKDPQGRPVLVLCEHTIPLTRYGQDALLRYVVSFLEPFSNAPFILVYAHAGINRLQEILDVIKELLRIAQFKYGPTMTLYCLHPTLSFKALWLGMSYYM